VGLKRAIGGVLGAVFLTAIPTPATAQTGSSSAFCVGDSTFIDRFANRLGWIELNQRYELAPLVECLASLDGTTNAELGEFMPRMFAALLKTDPTAFIHAIAGHPSALDHWLRDIDQAFVWASDPPSPMENERQRLIALVESADVEPAEAAVKARILGRLREARPRVID
jgi:hypothetical protein